MIKIPCEQIQLKCTQCMMIIFTVHLHHFNLLCPIPLCIPMFPLSASKQSAAAAAAAEEQQQHASNLASANILPPKL